MLEGLHSAAAGMAAQEDRIAAVANDLANASTTGYKPVRVGFRDLMYQEGRRPAADGAAARTGTGAATTWVGRSSAQGALQETGRELDVAIQGEGYLRVRLPDGRQALTRDGRLQLDGTGRLMTSTGALVQPPVTAPRGVAAGEVEIGADGTVTAAGRRIGRLELVTVPSRPGLESVGDNAFVPSAASGAPVRAPQASSLVPGTLEASGVDMSESMVAMIDAQRSYQLASKAITTADTMMEIANGLRR
jgi:flagellar basal-body rod protein FlgG